MSKNDWWQDLDDKNATFSGPSAQTTTATQELPRFSGTGNAEKPGFPSPAHTWGSGHRDPDPFVSPPSDVTSVTVEEVTEAEEAEIAKRAPAKEEPKEQLIPPMPSYAPDMPEAAPTTPIPTEPDATEEGDADKKGRIATFRAKVTEKSAPVRDVITGAMAASSGWSYIWSLGASWVFPVTFPIALLDRIATIFGSPRPLSGTEPMAWNFLHGPGVWFGQQIDTYDTGRLVVLLSVGVTPVIYAQMAERISRDFLRKALGWISYGFPAFFIAMPSYFNWAGFRTTNDMYITALAAAAWWGFTYSRTIVPGLWRIILRIPLAALIVGLGHTAPGAAF